MVIQLISDLHTELWKSYAEIVVSAMGTNRRVPDFLVLAGDIVSFARQTIDQIDGVFSFLSKKARHVVYVPGNHEYYGGTKASENNIKALVQRYGNFHWLDNSEITLDGVHFFGGTMWFPWLEDTKWRFEIGEDPWSDFAEIRDFRQTHWPYQLNKEFAGAAKFFLKPGSVVVTHHLPNHRSIASQHRLSATNRFFLSDQSEIIFTKTPRYWLHGHTHNACDYILDETRIVCNPHGYTKQPYPPVYLEI